MRRTAYAMIAFVTLALCALGVRVIGAQQAQAAFPHPRTSSYVLLNAGQANAARNAAWAAYRARECVARGLPGNCVLDVGPDGQRLTTPITTSYVRGVSSDDGTQHAIPLDDLTRAAVGGPPNLPEYAPAELPADIRAKLGL